MSTRFLRARECISCKAGYIVGGSTGAIAIIAAAGALTTMINRQPHLPNWSLWLVLLVGIAIAQSTMLFSKPLKASKLRAKIIQALITGPVVAMIIFQVAAVFSFWS